MLTSLFHEALYRPLYNGLIAAYVFLGNDLGAAIIAVTVVVRIILYPLMDRQYRSLRALQALQPKMREIREKHKDQQEQTKQLMALYKETGVHPASGCLPLLVQLPILFALYQAFANGLHESALSALYAWVPRPDAVNPLAFGFLDLARANVVLAVAAGVFQYVQARLMVPPKKSGNSKEEQLASVMNTQALYIMPVMTTVFALKFPAGLSLYWVTATILGILQQVLLLKRHGSSTTAHPLV